MTLEIVVDSWIRRAVLENLKQGLRYRSQDRVAVWLKEVTHKFERHLPLVGLPHIGQL